MTATRRWVCAIVGVSATIAVAGRGQEVVAPPKPPELRVLDAFVGTWNTDVHHKAAAWNPKEFKSSGTATYEWTLDGRFLQSRGLANPGKVEDLQIIGYDPEAKEYLMWYFNSQGAANGPVPGTWDPATRTLTWKGELGDGIVSQNPVRFVDKDTIEWRMTIQDKAGKLLVDVQGKLTRKK